MIPLRGQLLVYPAGGSAIAALTAERSWAPGATIGLLVLVVGFFEASAESPDVLAAQVTYLVVLAGLAGAVVLSRHAPGVALALVWAAGLVQVLGEVPILLVEVCVAVVFYGCARRGSTVTVVLSGLSIPAALGAAALLVVYGTPRLFGPVVYDLSGGPGQPAGAALAGLLLLAIPWLSGLTVRALTRARTSEVSQVAAEMAATRAEAQAEQAQEIARLREGQAQLARDVHDVVGHSLAVILAQAESGQFLPDDPRTLKQTLATIATSARSSLADVRQVLTATRTSAPPRPGDLDTLIEGVRSGGREVRTVRTGVARSLPPELGLVAYRVLQEMLTNALRHGIVDQPLAVGQHWPGEDAAAQGMHPEELRIEVSNAMELAAEPDPATKHSQGLDGMRRRLGSVGGHLEVTRRESDERSTFTVTARLPVRSGP